MKNFYRRGMLIIMFLLAMGLLVILAINQANAAPLSPPIYFNQQEIAGSVTNTSGEALLGVTVLVKNRQYGTTTDANGTYTINATTRDTLVFSFIGYKTQEIALKGRQGLDIVMEEDIASLNEVEINAGYYSVTERERTGNISRVTAEEIENQPVVSPLQALQGRMAGVEVSPGGISPGGAATVQIRGRNSLRVDGNYPLYIIDGVPVNPVPVETNSLLGNTGIDPLNNLDVSNIQSIEVLKDADATAIYGSRGANGVILITTQSGRAIGTGLEARVYTGASTVPQRLDLLNTQEYLEVRRPAFINDSVEPTERNAYDLVLWDQDRYTDWQEFLLGKTSQTTNARINFTGGGENTSFRLGGGYFDQGTVYPGDYSYKKATGNFSLYHQSKDDKLNLNLIVNYGIDKNNLVGNVSFNAATLLLPPNAPAIFTEEGELNWEDWAVARLDNPLEGYFNTSETKTNNLVSNFMVSYELLDGLILRSNLGYTNYSSAELWKLPARSYNPGSTIGNNSYHLNSGRTSWIVEPQLLYNKQWNKLELNTILGGTFQEQSSETQSFQGNGYVSESLIGNLAAADQILNAISQNSVYHYTAIFSRLGLNWDKKYFLNLTGRRDGSSRFGPNNRFANFGAIGTAWIFSEEKFIKDSMSFLSFGKLRGSYGITGNDQIGDYGYLDAYEATIGPEGLYPTALANPDYSWEVNKKLEGGLELGFFKDRLRLGISHYQNRSSSQLVGYPLAAITGFTNVQANLPATVENKGWEFEFSSENINTSGFSWNTSINLSIPRNRLVSYPNIEQSSFANEYRVGEPLNISLLYRYTGLDPETGFYTIEDVNGDETFDYQDRIIVQNQNRHFFGGIDNRLSYRDFTLQFLWQFVKQEGRNPLFNAGRPGNQLAEVLDSNNSFQRLSQSFQASRAFNYFLDTPEMISDASFLRLKTMALSYSIPPQFLQKIGIQKGKIFMHGQNLLTLTPYKGLDPELPYSGVSPGSLRTITGGLEINF